MMRDERHVETCAEIPGEPTIVTSSRRDGNGSGFLFFLSASCRRAAKGLMKMRARLTVQSGVNQRSEPTKLCMTFFIARQ